MRKQRPCSKCGFACSSTWRNLSPSKLIICNSCRSKEGNSIVDLDQNCPKQSANEEAKNNPFIGSSSFTQISPSSSIAHESVAFPVTQIGMIFGNLTFEPTLAIPVIIRGNSLEPKVKSEVVTVGDDRVTQVEDHFYRGENLKPSINSTLGDSTIQIKQEDVGEAAESEETAVSEAEDIWDSNKVQKKKRSKLPQYTLSPLARFINQLQHASCYRRRRRLRPYQPVAADPKYDDVLIYERCDLYVAENEIGLGAVLLSPPVYDSSTQTASFVMIKDESSSATATQTSA